MKKLVFIFFAGLFSLPILNAQSTITMGKTTIALPANKILNNETEYSIRANYLKFSNDTMYYYETYQAKGDNSQNTLTVYALPMQYVDKEYTNFNETKSEYIDGRTDMQYYTVVNLKYDAPKNISGWRFTYDTKGKVKKKKDSYIFVYCDGKSAFDLIKSNIK